VADALGLLPAPEERGREVLQRDLGREGLERGVNEPGGGAHGAAVDVDLGQPLALEQHEGIEEVEEDRVAGGRGHGSGFRWANPSSKPCQKRTAVSPYFQQRLTGSSPAPGATPAKSTRPLSTSFTTPPSASTSPSNV